MNREIDYSYLPSKNRLGDILFLRRSTREYIEKGVLPGPFLQAVICNKLSESFEEADKLGISDVFGCVCFFRNEAPVACWGSEKKMANWIKFRGLKGRKHLENVP